MANSTKVYLVGNEEAPVTNQWEAMTNSILEAERLMEELGLNSFKVITVAPPRTPSR